MARSHGVPACNEAPNSISTVVSDSGDLTAELMGTAPPSKLTIGVYPGGLATIDPSVPPPDEFDCIGGTDCVLVVFDHDHRIADVAQPAQRHQQAVVVALMKPDRGFVQHIEHAGQA